ncbi:hypothetical protein BLNAU_18508 [Blattamonas nauphoetae]|uniref:Uncharacterized protein n=1 Tax=Blattamonas nauphoetae TaxID=2049346 RepID=A0ABQ9X496_9EUKA|nr:hypothetical protein BLNAU_18508 [Blattamonas nauphoetae]
MGSSRSKRQPDDLSIEDHITICFVVCIAHAMEQEGTLDAILEGIRETSDQLDITACIPLATFLRATSVLLPLTRVGTSCGSDTGDEITCYDSKDSANDNPQPHAPRVDPSLIYRRVVMLIGNGSKNEGILDTIMIGASSNKYPYSISVPIVISTVGVEMQTAEEENVLPTDALDNILPTPNISCQSEPAPIVVTRTQKATLEAKKGNVRKAKEMAQEAQQTVNAFDAPLSSELGERLDVRNSRNWDDATATDMFTRVLLSLTRLSPEDQLNVQNNRSSTDFVFPVVHVRQSWESLGDIDDRTRELASETGESGVEGGKREVLVAEGSESQNAIDVSSSESGDMEEKKGVDVKQERAKDESGICVERVRFGTEREKKMKRPEVQRENEKGSWAE